MMALLLLSLLFAMAGCGPFEEVFVEEDLLQRPESKRCADCHAEIYREWERSRHAFAWKSENFRRESENYSKSKCLSCHAPHQVDPDTKPSLRVEFKDDGVGCVACHFKEETRAMHGPLKVWSPPHPSKQDLAYIKSNFCAGCHQETYKEWRRAKTEKSCQDCHMPSVGKKDLIQKFPFHYFHFAKPRHSHEFPTLKASEEELRVWFENGKLFIQNTGIPHNLPTADQGDPRLYLIARIRYEKGKIRTLRRVFSPQAGNALPHGTPIGITVPNAEGVSYIKVKIFRRLSWKRDRELILSRRLDGKADSTNSRRYGGDRKKAGG
jgi:hypothetical protein